MFWGNHEGPSLKTVQTLRREVVGIQAGTRIPAGGAATFPSEGETAATHFWEGAEDNELKHSGRWSGLTEAGWLVK